MYNLSYEQLKRRVIVSFVTSIILFIVMLAINIGEIQVGFLMMVPMALIAWTLELLGFWVCWRELWKPWLNCFFNAFKSFAGAGATGVPVVGFFIELAKSIGILTISCLKAFVIAIKVIIFVLKGKNNAS